MAGPAQAKGSTLSEASPRTLNEQVVFWAGVLFSVAHLYFNTLATLPELWTSALHFAGFGFLCALTCPGNGSARRRLLRVGNVILAILTLVCVGYLLLAEHAFYARGSSFIFSDWIFSIITVLLVIEFARRSSGWVIPILVVLSLSYVIWWGKWVGGVFHFPGLSVEIVLFRQYFGSDGMFGPIARISSTYVFMFILFGAFLVRSGAGDFIINLARCVVGRLQGGPGLVAVFGSALMGSISGSAVANTASTGVITIPLMKRSGFPPRFAAGVEAAASTGGQLMPPVMGAGAFVMSTYTQIPYVEIIGSALLPAVLYFFSVAVWVRIEAMKCADVVTADEDLPRFTQVIRQGGHNLLPITLLVSLLVYGFTPTYAAAYSILAVVVASWLSPFRMGPRAVLEALALGARNMVPTAILLVSVGMVVNVFTTTGIGNTFSLMVTDWAGGSLLVYIVLVALSSLILGMGLPVTAAYIVLATLSAPAIYDLITRMELIDLIASGQLSEATRASLQLFAPEQAKLIGVPTSHEQAAALAGLIPQDFMSTLIKQNLTPATLTAALLAAHMIIYWLSQDSNVTPPVCLTAFTAAGIAGTRPMQTGFTAWKVAKVLYIVPLLFAYTSLLSGTITEMLEISLFAACGIYALAGALEGYLEAPTSWLLRIILLALGTLLLWPVDTLMHIIVLCATVAVVTRNVYVQRHRITVSGSP